MDKIQQQSIILLLDTIETQIRGIKNIMGIRAEEGGILINTARSDDAFLSKREEEELERAMAMDEKTDMLLQDLAKELNAAPKDGFEEWPEMPAQQ